MASLYRRSGGIYYAAFSVKGKRIYRSTYATELDQAKVALVGFRREVAPEGDLTPKFSEFKEQQYLPYATVNLTK